jgi:hypothetical protein
MAFNILVLGGAFLTLIGVVMGGKGMAFIIGLGVVLMLFGFGVTTLLFTSIPPLALVVIILLIIFWMSKK